MKKDVHLLKFMIICLFVCLLFGCRCSNYVFDYDGKTRKIKSSDFFACESCKNEVSVADNIIPKLKEYFKDNLISVLYCPIFSDKKQNFKLVQFFMVATHEPTDHFFVDDNGKITIIDRSPETLKIMEKLLLEKQYDIKLTKQILNKVTQVIEANKLNTNHF